MDTNASAGRLFALPTAGDTTLQTSGDSPGPQHHRRSPASESGSSSDGGAAHRARRAQQATLAFQAPRVTFGIENPALNAAQQTHNDDATIFVDDPPYIPPAASHSSQNVQFGQTQTGSQFSSDFFDYHTRPPPSATQSPFQLEPDRRHSAESSPTGSAHSQSSDRSGYLSGRSQRSVSSGASNHGSQYTGQNMQMQEPYHVQQPANPALAFNQEHYPAFDPSGERRVGLEHLRYDNVPNQGSAEPYYRPRTHTYPGTEGPHVLNISLNTPHPVDMSAFTRPDGPPVPLPPATPQLQLETRLPRAQGRAELAVSPEPLARQGAGSHLPTRGSHSDSSAVPDAAPSLRKLLGLSPEEEVSLYSLADPPSGEKPNYPYPTLIKLAIHGSPRKRLTLQEIYAALEGRFEWFRENSHDKAWQNSIRHNLSLNKTFRKVTKPITEPGKGSYWVVDYSEGEGNKRIRKRNKRPTKAELARRAQEAARQEESSSGDDNEGGGAGSPGGGSGTSQPPSTSALEQTASEDLNIDPELRNQGHIVGHGRLSAGTVTRSAARRAQSSPYSTGSSPGPSQPRVATPAAPQMPPPQLMLMSAHERAQRQVAFSQYAFGQTSFTPSPFGQPEFGQPSAVPPRLNWAQHALSPAQVQAPSPAPAIPPVARSSRAASAQDLDIRNAPIRVPTPRPGIQHVREPSGRVVARRIDSGNAGPSSHTMFPQQQTFAQGMPPRSGGPAQDQGRGRSSSGSSGE